MSTLVLNAATEDTAVDALILALIATDRQADESEMQRIVTHLARAPFASRPVRVTRWMREQLTAQGISVNDRLPAIETHLLKRVYLDRQWPIGATVEEYLADLHRAISHPAAQIWTYRYYGEPMIGFLSPSHVQTVPSPQPFIFVAYNPRYGLIITGYQASGPDTIFTDGFEQARKQR
jgi:hypothetical protein